MKNYGWWVAGVVFICFAYFSFEASRHASRNEFNLVSKSCESIKNGSAYTDSLYEKCMETAKDIISERETGSQDDYDPYENAQPY